MILKASGAMMKVPVSGREFEILLRRASELNKPSRLRLVKASQPTRRSPRSAA
jgi:hypothetical protein